MMVHDRYFYDPATLSYTVDKYLKDVSTRYGGIDSVLLWHTYSNIGIDDRNQFDMFRDLPGGRKESARWWMTSIATAFTFYPQ